MLELNHSTPAEVEVEVALELHVSFNIILRSSLSFNQIWNELTDKLVTVVLGIYSKQPKPNNDIKTGYLRI